MRTTIYIFLISVLSFGCDSNGSQSKLTPVTSTLIAKDNLYGNGAEGIDQQNLVITDQGIWTDLLTQMDAVNDVSSSFSEIDIDFSEYTIIAVFDELKSSGGHSIELNIISNSEQVIVSISHTIPEGNALTVMTQPFHIVKISNSDLPIVFE